MFTAICLGLVSDGLYACHAHIEGLSTLRTPGFLPLPSFKAPNRGQLPMRSYLQ
jgi:hypothetical protein